MLRTNGLVPDECQKPVRVITNLRTAKARGLAVSSDTARPRRRGNRASPAPLHYWMRLRQLVAQGDRHPLIENFRSLLVEERTPMEARPRLSRS